MSVANRLNPGFAEFPKYLHPLRASIVACLFVVIPEHLWAQDCIPHGQSLDGLPILKVTIDNGDIFDLEQEDQNLLIHRWANRLHINTQKKTIKEQLLFDPEEGYSEQLVKETERLLRNRNYIHDAKITVEEDCGDGVELTIATTDNWTLTPSITASRSGGETRTSFEIEEANLLGLGSELKILSDSDEERDSNAFVFRDRNWLGNFKILNLELADNSDGHLYQASVTRPFIKLDSNYAWSVAASSDERENQIYEQGDVVGKVGEMNDSLLLAYGWSEGLVDGSVSRYSLGWFANRLRYNTVDDPNIELPADVDKYYPYLEHEYLNVKYVEKINFRVMGITEDIKLGSSLRTRIGWKDEAYESTQEGYVLEFEYNFGSFISAHTLGLFDLKLNQESNKSIDDTGQIVMEGKLYNFRGENNSYVFSSRLEAAQNPELFDRIEVGGDSGLKGYPVRFQNGERALTLSAERRAYFNVYLWQMVKFGYAVFAEVGSAWDNGENPVWLSDVGTGLRLVSTRQSNAKVLHIDIAFPLSEKNDIDDYQFFVKARTEF
jgi:outer membrane protein assembly factor BamA